MSRFLLSPIVASSGFALTILLADAEDGERRLHLVCRCVYGLTRYVDMCSANSQALQLQSIYSLVYSIRTDPPPELRATAPARVPVELERFVRTLARRAAGLPDEGAEDTGAPPANPAQIAQLRAFTITEGLLDDEASGIAEDMCAVCLVPKFEIGDRVLRLSVCFASFLIMCDVMFFCFLACSFRCIVIKSHVDR
jgi:hypothetical protein